MLVHVSLKTLYVLVESLLSPLNTQPHPQQECFWLCCKPLITFVCEDFPLSISLPLLLHFFFFYLNADLILQHFTSRTIILVFVQDFFSYFMWESEYRNRDLFLSFCNLFVWILGQKTVSCFFWYNINTLLIKTVWLSPDASMRKWLPVHCGGFLWVWWLSADCWSFSDSPVWELGARGK